uniref:Uncharacterized protein n=1 Tax=Strigamia maritima TaxID=126957 RepID=T1J8Y5_STRMM
METFNYFDEFLHNEIPNYENVIQSESSTEPMSLSNIYTTEIQAAQTNATVIDAKMNQAENVPKQIGQQYGNHSPTTNNRLKHAAKARVIRLTKKIKDLDFKESINLLELNIAAAKKRNADLLEEKEFLDYQRDYLANVSSNVEQITNLMSNTLNHNQHQIMRGKGSGACYYTCD